MSVTLFFIFASCEPLILSFTRDFLCIFDIILYKT